MANNDSTAALAEPMQPLVITREQFNQLGQLAASNHADNQNLQKLQQAVRTLDDAIKVPL